MGLSALFFMDLIVADDAGLYCPQGDFYIDPWGKLKTAIITHAHSDHLRPGSKNYTSSNKSSKLIKHRLLRSKHTYNQISYDYGEIFQINGVTISLHPAGHILGSSQVRLEYKGHVTVLTGDFKLQPDPTCEPFQQLKTDTLITQATFGLPIYRWQDNDVNFDNVYNWHLNNQIDEKTTKLFGYSLAKTQRIMAEIANRMDEAIYIHGAIEPITDIYRQEGIILPETRLVVNQDKSFDFSNKIVISPPGALRSNYMNRFENFSSAFVSGWSRVRGRRRMGGYDHGFVISDHVDFPGLIETIEQSKATDVHVGFTKSDVFVRYLREELGYEAKQFPVRYTELDD